jgi:hypothetical protein
MPLELLAELVDGSICVSVLAQAVVAISMLSAAQSENAATSQ